jgi:putative ABC transport system ATP-binding protein
MAEVLQLQNIQKWVGQGSGRTDILRGVSMVLNQGEFIAIMGASGSGKSTLLNMIGLLDRPSAGSMRLLGREVATVADDEQATLRSQHLGFIFQSFHLLPYLSAQENIELPMLYTRRADRAARAKALLEQMSLTHRRNAYPGTLSGGERQRVAIARAFANEPTLILADEPTGALDSKTGVQILDLLSALHRAGRTIIVVTHDENVAKRAQRTLRMVDGRFER